MSLRLLAVLVALLVVGACGEQAAPLPTVAPEGLEPAVATRLDATRRAAEEDRSAASLLTYGRVLLGHRHHAAAGEVLRRAATLGGSGEFESTYLAALALSESDLPAAERLMSRALTLEPRFASGHLKQGLFREELERLADAESSFATALRLERSSHALLGLARIAIQRDEMTRAIGLLEEARTVDARHHEVDVALAQAYAVKGWDDEARAARDRATGHASLTAIPDPVLDRALDENVSYHGVVDRAQHRFLAGDVAGALHLLDQAARIDAAHARAYLVSAQIQGELGDHAGVVAACERVLAVTPDYAEALARRGAALAALGEVAQAEASLRAGVAAGGGLPVPRRELARFLVTRESDEARPLLESLLRDHPDDLVARVLLASVHAAAGEWEDAQAQARYVTRRRPQNAMAQRILAEATRER